ncbi:MAG: DUF86 domain-containing protein [Geothrix sp.]|nr:DUF86 domain-containing protein [Geothrix sp.]
MIQAGTKAMALLGGRTRDQFESDETLILALTRLLEILGEAAKAVPEEVKAKAPDIPWKAMAGTRDRLIHGYFDVDLDVVWAILSTDLPELLPMLQRLLNEP